MRLHSTPRDGASPPRRSPRGARKKNATKVGPDRHPPEHRLTHCRPDPAVLFVLTIVVFFHELGHFLVARWCGVAVKVFSIGFGPELIGFNDRKGTRWQLSAIPLGGYVKFLGDENAAERGRHGRASRNCRRGGAARTFPGKSVGRGRQSSRPGRSPISSSPSPSSPRSSRSSAARS